MITDTLNGELASARYTILCKSRTADRWVENNRRTSIIEANYIPIINKLLIPASADYCARYLSKSNAIFIERDIDICRDRGHRVC